MRDRLPRIAIVLAAILVVAGGSALAQGAGPALARWVIGGGGGPASGGSFALDGTLGQPVAGPSSGGAYTLNAGYWQEDTRAPSTVVLTSSANPVPVGALLTLTATVSGERDTPAGTVTFKDGATALGTAALDGDGVATLTTDALGQGMHALTALYSGDASYLGSTSAVLDQAVGLHATTTTISAPAVTYDAAATVLVTVSSATGGTPSGTVSLSVDGGAPLSQSLDATGEASFTLPLLDAGDHALSAIYAAQADCAPSSATATLRVRQAATSVTLTSSRNPSAPGDEVTLTARVEAVAPGGGTPVGTVTFRDGAADLGSGALAGGVATLTTAALAAGDHAISAAYAGSANHAPGASAVLTQTVNAAQNPVPVLVSLSPDHTAAGGTGLILTVTGSGFVAASEVCWDGAARPRRGAPGNERAFQPAG